MRGARPGTRGTDAPPTGRQGCLPHIGGSNLRVETYTANELNQYTQRTVPGFAEVQGRARSDATVTVNLQSTLRQGPYWRAELNADNSASPLWLGITNVAVLRGAGTGGTDLEKGSVLEVDTWREPNSSPQRHRGLETANEMLSASQCALTTHADASYWIY